MESVKKKIINGKLVAGVINDALEVKIPFEHDDIEVINLDYGEKLYVCKNGDDKTVYNSQFKILFYPKGRRQFVQYLYNTIYLITDRGRKNLSVASVYMDSKSRRNFKIILDFGSFDEIEKKYCGGYELVKHTKDGNLEGKLRDPIYGLISPIYKRILRKEKWAEYCPRFRCYDKKGLLKVQALDVCPDQHRIYHLLTTILKDGKELQGVQLRDENHQIVDFLNNEYSSINFNYDDQIVNLETNGKKGVAFYSEHWNTNGKFYTFAREIEIECLYDNISFIKENSHYRRGPKESIRYAITELDNQKDLYHIDYKYVTGDVDWEGFEEEPYGKCVKLNKYSQDDYKYIQNGIFIGIKNKEKSIILNDYDKDNNPITLSSEDWDDIDILEKTPLKSWGYRSAIIFNEPSTSYYFSAIITLKNGNKKFIQYNHRNRFENPIITETKQFKDLSTFGDNQLLAENEDSSKDIINYFNEIIIKDYNDSSILMDNRFRRYTYDQGRKQIILTNDCDLNKAVDELDSKYTVAPIYLNGMWKKELDGNVTFFSGLTGTINSFQSHENFITDMLNQSYSYFNILSISDEDVVINCGLKNSDESVTDIFERIKFYTYSTNGKMEEVNTLLQGKFNIKNYDKQNSRTIISIPNEENSTERYGVIENKKGNICISFDFDNIEKNKNGGFDATQQGFKFEFDKDGFLVEDSISADSIASDNKAKQFKKTINN